MCVASALEPTNYTGRHWHALSIIYLNFSLSSRREEAYLDNSVIILDDPLVYSVVGKVGAMGIRGVIAGDLEALTEAARLHAKRVRDAYVAALVGATHTCDPLLLILLSSSLLDQVRRC